MSRRSAARRSALAAALIGLLLAACTTDDKPPPPPTPAQTTPADAAPSPEPTTEPGPGPTPWPEPTRPAAMERDDLDGAIAAAEYFLALYPYIYATGDLSTWEEMSHAECEFCQGAYEDVSAIHAAGGYALGGNFAVEDVSAAPPDDEFPHFRIGLSGVEAPASVHSSTGELESSTSGGLGTYHVAVLRTGDEWLIRGARTEGADG